MNRREQEKRMNWIIGIGAIIVFILFMIGMLVFINNRIHNGYRDKCIDKSGIMYHRTKCMPGNSMGNDDLGQYRQKIMQQTKQRIHQNR